MTNEKTFQFTGYKSGDYEAFCFAVPKNILLKYTTLKKLDRTDVNPFHKGYFNLHPDDLLRHLDNNKKYEFEITIKAKEVN